MAVDGNEDDARHISGVLFQCVNEVGFTLATQAIACWNDEA